MYGFESISIVTWTFENHHFPHFVENLLDSTFDYFLSTMKLKTLNNSVIMNIMIHNVCLRQLCIPRYPKVVQTGRSYAKNVYVAVTIVLRCVLSFLLVW